MQLILEAFLFSSYIYLLLGDKSIIYISSWRNLEVRSLRYLYTLQFPLKSVAIYSSAGASKRGSELRAYSQDNSFTNSRKVPESYRYRLQGIGKLSNHFRRGLEAYSHSGALAEQAETLADNGRPAIHAVDLWRRSLLLPELCLFTDLSMASLCHAEQTQNPNNSGLWRQYHDVNHLDGMLLSQIIST